MALVPDLPLRRRTDLYRTTTTDISGQFRLLGIAPGSYKAFAWEEVDRDIWQNPEFMQINESRGRPVEIREGSQAGIELTAIPPARR
jgi:hypothetical protein